MIKLIIKRASKEKKKRNSIRKRKLIDAPYAKYISSENIYILKLYCQRQSTSSQIFVEIKVIQGVVFPEISKLNDSAPDKKPKYSRKRKIGLILSNIFAITPIDGSCYRVFNSSILQDFFSSGFVLFTALRLPFVILYPNLMTVQTIKGKVPYVYKGLIRKIMTFEYEKLLLLKSTQNKVASNIEITKQNKASQAYHICQKHF